MIEQDSDIDVVYLGNNQWQASMMAPGKTSEEIVFAFINQTHREQVLDTSAEVVACSLALRKDSRNEYVFGNNVVINSAAPVFIRDPLCINGIEGMGKPDPVIGNESSAEIPWNAICGTSIGVAVGLMALGIAAVRITMALNRGHVPKAEPVQDIQRAPPIVYQTPSQRENLYDELGEAGFDIRDIDITPEGDVLHRDPLIGPVVLAKIGDGIVRYSNAAQREEIIKAHTYSRTRVSDEYLPDGMTGVMVSYDLDQRGDIIPESGKIVGIYDPVLDTTESLPGTHPQENQP